MNRPKDCPECGGSRTTRQHLTFEVDQVTEVRTCDACPTQYEVTYGDPIKEATLVEAPNGKMVPPEVRDEMEASDD